MFLERDGRRWTKLTFMHTLGFLSLLVFSDPVGNPQNPCGMQKLTALFHATLSLENLHIISRIIRFDNRDTRPARRQRDKLAAIRSVWDKWVDSLPLFYNPGLPLLLMSSIAYAI